MKNGAIDRPTRIEVDLNAIEHNIRTVAAHLPAGVEMMAIVKANGYGHGAVPIARQALAAGATRIGVAVLDEAVELREAGITSPILVMGYTSPAGLVQARALGISCTVYTLEQVTAAIALAEQDRTSPPLRVHVKADTGMHRLGFTDVDAFAQACAAIVAAGTVQLEGVFTHFATADEADASYAHLQMERFSHYLGRLRALGIAAPIVHVNNSAGALQYPEWGHTTVRLGIAMYGLHPTEHVAVKSGIVLRPALVLKSAIVHVKEVPAGSALSYGRTYVTPQAATIATIPIGYGDGYARVRSNRGYVLVRGERAPIVGRVCMDQLLVDVTGIANVAHGDEVVLIGEQGAACITAAEVAAWSDTIHYEVVTALGARIPRCYSDKV